MKQPQGYSIEHIVALQHFSGYWFDIKIIEKIFSSKVAEQISISPNLNEAITYLVTKWM